jgi:hypothetical protein
MAHGSAPSAGLSNARGRLFWRNSNETAQSGGSIDRMGLGIRPVALHGDVAEDGSMVRAAARPDAAQAGRYPGSLTALTARLQKIPTVRHL